MTDETPHNHTTCRDLVLESDLADMDFAHDRVRYLESILLRDLLVLVGDDEVVSPPPWKRTA
jgi:hypothetical protein